LGRYACLELFLFEPLRRDIMVQTYLSNDSQILTVQVVTIVVYIRKRKVKIVMGSRSSIRRYIRVCKITHKNLNCWLSRLENNMDEDDPQKNEDFFDFFQAVNLLLYFH